MSRKLFSFAALVAVFTVALGTADAEARNCCRSHHRSHRCCHNGSYGNINQGYANCGYQQRTNCGYQQAANIGCQPTSQFAMNGGCSPQTTCCAAQSACAVMTAPAIYSAPQPVVQELPPAPALAPAPAPAPGN